MPTLIHRRVEAARTGANPSVIARLPSGWAVLGDFQYFRGYSLLLADPVVPALNSLGAAARAAFLEDMGKLGDAVLAVTGAARVNYEILGNSEAALHAHVFPRRSDEPAEQRAGPVWFGPWNDPSSALDPAVHGGLLAALREALAGG